MIIAARFRVARCRGARLRESVRTSSRAIVNGLICRLDQDERLDKCPSFPTSDPLATVRFFQIHTCGLIVCRCDLAVVMDLYSRRIFGWAMDRYVGRLLVQRYNPALET